MITLHSSAPWLPVCLGSLVAFLLLTFSAVVAATLVQHAKLSERFVLGVSAWPGHRFRSPCFFLNGEFDGKKIMGFWENLRNSWQFMGFFGVIFDLRVNFLGMEAAISWGYRGFLCDDHPIPKHG